MGSLQGETLRLIQNFLFRGDVALGRRDFLVDAACQLICGVSKKSVGKDF